MAYYDIYACGNNVAISVCRDARLRGEKDIKTDKVFGQSGWKYGLMFDDFKDLIKKIVEGKMPHFMCGNNYFDCDPPGPGSIRALAIEAHGFEGMVDINCRGRATSPPKDGGLTALTLNKYYTEFAALDFYLSTDAILYFMSCNVALGKIGSEFLKKVSKRLWGRLIVGISSVGYSVAGKGRQGRPYEKGWCEAGMRDTHFRGHAASEDEFLARVNKNWDNLDEWPWASYHSPHSKTARNNMMVGLPSCKRAECAVKGLLD